MEDHMWNNEQKLKVYNVQRRVFQNTVQTSALQAHFFLFFVSFTEKKENKKQKVSIFLFG